MLGTIRYKDVRNTTGAVFTASNFPDFSDGNDKQEKKVKRTLSAIDIGADPGKAQSTIGVIVEVIPSNYTVLWVEITVARPLNATVGGSTVYSNVVGLTLPLPDPTNQTDILWYVDSSNCLRVIDNGESAATELKVKDVIFATIYLGTRDSALDVINP